MAGNRKYTNIADAYWRLGKLAVDWCESVSEDAYSIVVYSYAQTRGIADKLTSAITKKYCKDTEIKRQILSELDKIILYLEQNAEAAAEALEADLVRNRILESNILIGDGTFCTLDCRFIDTVMRSKLAELLIRGKDLESMLLGGIRNRREKYVRYAINRGADVNKLYNLGYGEGLRPIMLTKAYFKYCAVKGTRIGSWVAGTPNIAELLIRYGADLSGVNSNNHNFLDYLFFSDSDCYEVCDGRQSLPYGIAKPIPQRVFNTTTVLIEKCLSSGLKIRKSPQFGIYPYALCALSVHDKTPYYLAKLLKERPECFENPEEALDEYKTVNKFVILGLFHTNTETEEQTKTYLKAIRDRTHSSVSALIRSRIVGTNADSFFINYSMEYIRTAGAESYLNKLLAPYRIPFVRTLFLRKPRWILEEVLLKILPKIIGFRENFLKRNFLKNFSKST